MKRKTVIDIISFLLILLFIYTAMSKILNFNQFKGQMYNQTLSHGLATLLIWTLPGIEILTGLLLLFEKTKPYGFYISILLMTVFTGYIILVLLNYFGRVPCSCGGVIKAMGWKLHLLFNLFFLLLSTCAIFIINRERRLVGKEK
ncbi:MauE/DoxX family redox-associated membrane protein [Mucilaginibacter sp.]|uniref:MauE/DoxX family redox-associated membrane protein n=1 Tax=Mucilaginibacter sp. TaxID=1882438 RepID=UPI0035BC5E61